MYVVGWGNTQQSEPGFGASNDTASVKAKIVNLIASVRTLMRSMFVVLISCWGGKGEGGRGYEEWEFLETATVLMVVVDV